MGVGEEGLILLVLISEEQITFSTGLDINILDLSMNTCGGSDHRHRSSI